MTPQQSSDIKAMEKTCRLAAETLYYTAKFVKAGVTTNELDKIAHDFIMTKGATPSPLGYHGFPKSICTSINDVVCHGVPDETMLVDGDAINLDVTTYLGGFHGDTSATFYVGEVSERVRKVTDCAREAMMRGIEAITPLGFTGDIGFATNKHVTRQGFYVVRDIGGHGIGRKFHTDPFVPAFGKKGKGEVLKPFHCITVEPMVNETDAQLIELSIPKSDIKVYRTGDKTLSAQFEHTVLITDKGYEILTVAP